MDRSTSKHKELTQRAELKAKDIRDEIATNSFILSICIVCFGMVFITDYYVLSFSENIYSQICTYAGWKYSFRNAFVVCIILFCVISFAAFRLAANINSRWAQNKKYKNILGMIQTNIELLDEAYDDLIKDHISVDEYDESIEVYKMNFADIISRM